jgi:hypothetical protein
MKSIIIAAHEQALQIKIDKIYTTKNGLAKSILEK